MCVEEGMTEVFASIPIWFIVLLCVTLFGAVFLRSMILSIAVIVVCVVAMVMMYDVEGINEFIRYGMMAVWIALAGGMVWQLVFRVDRI